MRLPPLNTASNKGESETAACRETERQRDRERETERQRERERDREREREKKKTSLKTQCIDITHTSHLTHYTNRTLASALRGRLVAERCDALAGERAGVAVLDLVAAEDLRCVKEK